MDNLSETINLETPPEPGGKRNDEAVSVVIETEQREEISRENQDKEEELPRWWELTNIFIAHCSYMVVMIDFEDRSAELGFIVDSFDMAMNCCCVLVVIVRVILEFQLGRQITKILVADVVIALICVGGIIYEAAIAQDFNQFLEAETLPANVIRTFKCFKLFVLFLERKYYWKKLHDLIMVLADSLSRVLHIFCLWLIIILVFTIVGHHIEGGRILIDSNGALDMDEGSPNRFHLNDIYHALIFILLDSFDEEWDYLMFKEYLGVNPIIVVFQMITMFICYLLFFKYLIGCYTNELDVVLSETKHEDEEPQESENESVEIRPLPNRVTPTEVDS